jgi:hypothetical protein
MSRVWSVYDAQLKVNWTCFHCLNNSVHMGGSISSSTHKDCRTWLSWEEEHHHHLFLKLNVSCKQKSGTLYLYQGLLFELCSQVLGYYHFKWTPYCSGCILCVLLLLQGAIWFSLKMITLSHSKSPFSVGFLFLSVWAPEFVFSCSSVRLQAFMPSSNTHNLLPGQDGVSCISNNGDATCTLCPLLCSEIWNCFRAKTVIVLAAVWGLFLFSRTHTHICLLGEIHLILKP